MPPQRTFPPVKPVKTERTHEENQERAYIAASRRSDRSLEARVESARRASDIHKKRTGRSLRVTEQDVINEEMYEEEDDDLPSQYRRLTAHLQTGSADFNRRLAAYLTNHVAMRSALSEALNGNFSQHFPNAPQFAHNNNMFPSPIMTQGFAPQQHQMQSPTPVSPHTPHHPYRQTPYPMPGQQQYRPNPRAMSMQMSPQNLQQAQMSPAPVTPGAQLPSQHAAEPFRRASMPGPAGLTFPPQNQQGGPQQLPSPKSEASPRMMTPIERPASKPGSAPASIINGPVSQHQVPLHQPQPQHPPQQLIHRQNAIQPQAQFQRQGRPQSIAIPDNNLAPFTMSLAPNDAAIINPSALPHNSFGAALMGNDFDWNPNFDNSAFGASDPGSMFKPGANFHPNMVGMNTTLAPDEMFKIGSGQFDPNVTTPGNFDMGNFINFGDNSNGPSAAGTPGDAGVSFGEFVDGAWGETGT